MTGTEANSKEKSKTEKEKKLGIVCERGHCGVRSARHIGGKDYSVKKTIEEKEKGRGKK